MNNQIFDAKCMRDQVPWHTESVAEVERKEEAQVIEGKRKSS